ncbi:hypothetical protein UA08_08765 [Talaromyces atroroseus]|uniref:2-iminobutanoate/2-iminopropanoate deaminase n=1 Tax=Talaromyces atroroseus TaxID=1441469 RepID=A0A225A874_TALAT|nr:hypothetical protein UA08_08765 [Talaromyces atroroseus]OKL56080.1 hypothetical protein UA08_08765 [Talaromyces atroroseus]
MADPVLRLKQHQQHLSPPEQGPGKTGLSCSMTPIFTKDACPPNLSAAGPYSQAFQAAGQIFCSGQLPMDTNGVLTSGSIAEKTEQCIRNLKTILEEAGSGIHKVVKVAVFLSDMHYFAEMNGEYEKWFLQKPARTCIAVKGLPKNVDVEIEAIAIL